MIRTLVFKAFAGGRMYIEAAGLSGDVKPTEGIVTGSLFREVDTGMEYAFDEASGIWTAQNAGNGKTSLAGAVVTLGTALKYTGSEQTQGVSSVVLGSTTLTASTDYEVIQNKGTEVGSYELFIVGKGSYTGIVGKAWSIGKADGSMSASPDSLSLTAGGEAGTSELTITGDGEISVDTSNADVAWPIIDGTTVTVEPVGEGSATVTVMLGEGERYGGATGTISVSVAAAEEG